MAHGLTNLSKKVRKNIIWVAYGVAYGLTNLSKKVRKNIIWVAYRVAYVLINLRIKIICLKIKSKIK